MTNTTEVRVGLGHGQSAMERLNNRAVHNLSGHRIIFLESDDQLKIVCRNCSLGREVPESAQKEPVAKEYLLGEFIVEIGTCSRSM